MELGSLGSSWHPLRLAVQRRLLALPSWLVEHHTASLQPDVIKPEARCIENACEFPKMHCLALPFRWGVPATLGNGQSWLGEWVFKVLLIVRRRLRAPRADMSCHFPLYISERACPATARSTKEAWSWIRARQREHGSGQRGLAVAKGAW